MSRTSRQNVRRPEPLWKADAFKIALDATIEHNPRRVFALFSGGNDSSVLVHWAAYGPRAEPDPRLESAKAKLRAMELPVGASPHRTPSRGRNEARGV